MRKLKSAGQSHAEVLDAMMKFRGYGFRHCEIRDLTMQGVFVLSSDGTLTKLSKDEPVEIAIKLRTNGKVKTHLFRAQVTTVSRQGAGLSFHDADVDAYSALLHLNIGQH